MDFRIADTFTDSLAKLTGEEQKLVKTTAFDLQMNPANPGMQFHKLDKAKDKNFWSVRVSRDIRIIVHKSDTSLLLCFVGHHDDAYHWAERRKLETHPKTGAAQLVEIRERVEEVIIPKYVEVTQSVFKPLLFTHITDDELLSYGIPEEWLTDVRGVNEDTLFALTEHLPGEAAEALLELATGGKPQLAYVQTIAASPFEHPDAQRRFRVMNNIEELEQALEYPWEKWMVFLHPSQKELVEKTYSGPARISGSAGTGKTIVALHRAVYLARKNPEARVLLTTLTDSLARALHYKLKLLISSEPRLAERLEVLALNTIGARIYMANFNKVDIATRETIRGILSEVSKTTEDNKFSLHFLLSEWEQIVDAWQISSWEEYRDVKRLGRKIRLPEQQRRVLWTIFDKTRNIICARELITHSYMFNKLANHLASIKNVPFEFVVVDEAQDIDVAQLNFLSKLGGGRENSLFFAGDLGQRIFQQAFSWKSLGVDIRGRSRTLRVNYRTSHQIRTQADKLLGPEISDVDGNTEDRRGTVSVFNGPYPEFHSLPSIDKEINFVSDWLNKITADGIKPHEIGVFVRSADEIFRAKKSVDKSGLPIRILNDNVEPANGYVTISTMHYAKGLEFRAVVVMACDDEVVPSQSRIEMAADETELLEIYNTERHLLYVACTRARDRLLVTSGGGASEFIDDMK